MRGVVVEVMRHEINEAVRLVDGDRADVAARSIGRETADHVGVGAELGGGASGEVVFIDLIGRAERRRTVDVVAIRIVKDVVGRGRGTVVIQRDVTRVGDLAARAGTREKVVRVGVVGSAVERAVLGIVIEVAGQRAVSDPDDAGMRGILAPEADIDDFVDRIDDQRID